MKWFAASVVGLVALAAWQSARAQVPVADAASGGVPVVSTVYQPGTAVVEQVRWARPYGAYYRPNYYGGYGYRFGYANPYRAYRPYYSGYGYSYPYNYGYGGYGGYGYGTYYRGNAWYGTPRAYRTYRYWR
jgi:hypothetical protein